MKHLVILLIPCAAFAEDDFRHGLNSEVLRLTWSENILPPPPAPEKSPAGEKPKVETKPKVEAKSSAPVEPTKKKDPVPSYALRAHPDFPPEFHGPAIVGSPVRAVLHVTPAPVSPPKGK